jgi:hypothetical protein
LNGATDYSVESGGNSYTKSYVDTDIAGYTSNGTFYNSSSSNWDNSTNDEAFVELRFHNYNLGSDPYNRRTFNIKNISAGFSKVAIPISPPTNLAGTTPANTQQVNLTWTVSPESVLSFNHVIYWKKASGSPIVIDPDDNTTYDGRIVTGQNANSYTHSGLDGATQYNYVIRAETSVGGVSTFVGDPLAPENALSITTNSIGGPNTDSDEDLLVYYEFDGDLTDTAQYHGDNRYDLTAVSGANIVFEGSRFSNNTAAYFDASNGYAYNNSLNDANEADLFSSGDFTVSLWFYADEDMKQFSSLMSSRYVPDSGDDGGIQSWQLDANKDEGLRWRSQAGDVESGKGDRVHTSTENPYPANQWSHAAFVKRADGTALIYMNGVLEATSRESQPTPMYALKIGTNRREEHPWKGYIDEFKIYKRALTAQEVNNLYINDAPN